MRPFFLDELRTHLRRTTVKAQRAWTASATDHGQGLTPFTTAHISSNELTFFEFMEIARE
jgi:hypothetical protein